MGTECLRSYPLARAKIRERRVKFLEVMLEFDDRVGAESVKLL